MPIIPVIRETEQVDLKFEARLSNLERFKKNYKIKINFFKRERKGLVMCSLVKHP